MTGQDHDPRSPEDFRLDLTRPPVRVEGELAWESTMTAPTEWVPRVHSDDEINTVVNRRGFSIASFACGLLGLLLGIFGILGATFALAAVILASIGLSVEPGAKTWWGYGFVTGAMGLAIAAGWVVYVTQVLLPALG